MGSTPMFIPSPIKVLAGIVATVVLGAIGSGVWEKVLSPALSWASKQTIDAIANTSSVYRNSIYRAAAAGFSEDFSFRTFLLLTLLSALAFLLFGMTFSTHMRSVHRRLLALHRRWLELAVLVSAIAFSLSIFVAIGKHEAVKRTATYALRSLDIVRPFVGEPHYHLLVSEFYRIRTATDFTEFHAKVRSAANDHKLVLPEYEPY